MSLKLPQWRLRDLFWLMLILSIAAAWGWEHYRDSQQLTELKRSFHYRFLEVRDRRQPSGESERRAAVQALEAMSDDQLLEQFHNPPESDPLSQARWLEMARRRMSPELKARFGRKMHEPYEFYDRDANCLTALRRAEGKPDPLKIHVQLLERNHQGERAPVIEALVENLDSETFDWCEGCDDRSGRRTRWRIELIAEDGRRVPDSNFTSFGMGGGLGTIGSLAPQAKGRPHSLDARAYVSPPPSGRYQLQLFHSDSDNDIAGDPDTTGLIVWKSEPISVFVENHTHTWKTWGARQAIGLMGIAVGLAMAATGRWRLTRRDACGLALAIALLIGWLIDSSAMHTEILRCRPDTDANWSMTVAHFARLPISVA